jgi:hypothetical protein
MNSRKLIPLIRKRRPEVLPNPVDNPVQRLEDILFDQNFKLIVWLDEARELVDAVGKSANNNTIVDPIDLHRIQSTLSIIRSDLQACLSLVHINQARVTLP